jgi:sterol desaturase/sphingolipid hydroxylase (fatty acid hydroxylase superfamily)
MSVLRQADGAALKHTNGDAIGAVVLPAPSGVRRDLEARKARRRLYPVSFLYTAYAMAILGTALRSSHRVVALLSFALGIGAWTWLEYLVHRHILHGRFPDGPSLWRHALHKYFDHLHIEHHQRPWDGNHVSGTIRDTLPFAAVLAAIAFLFPFHTAPVFLAGVLQAYIAEEWVHHSVHFCQFKGRYFQYIKRHHLYHHSPRGAGVGYGLSSGIWDVVWQTRIPEDERRLLYARSAGRRRGSSPAAPGPPSLAS